MAITKNMMVIIINGSMQLSVEWIYKLHTSSDNTRFEKPNVKQTIEAWKLIALGNILIFLKSRL